MTCELVFHLGDRKTGSTSIQKTLTDGLWNSDSRSLYYTANGHNGPLAKALATGANADMIQQRFANLGQRLTRHASEADVAVVSSEGFEDVAPKTLKLALEAYLPDYADSVRLIAYVRPHGARVLSGYSEQVKRGQSVGSLESYFSEGMALGRFDAFPRLSEWRDVFGAAFTLRPMIREGLYQNCVVQDFLRYALQSEDFSLSWQPDSNPSLCSQDIAMLRDIHQQLDGAGVSPAQAGYLGAALGEQMAEHPNPDGQRLQLPEALAEQVIAGCKQDAAALDQMFFDGTPMGDALNALKGAGDTLAAPSPDAARIAGLMGAWLGRL
ncbi:hypothetical protein [Neptunicoccus sediminis]|uniref:hypothetical protein n=1 Tax=Neptunicoccus sediminis TaxID=1892596 RepID=UPI0008462281|nr:hypothetical protein [Neptunicoccus sediminis]